MAIMQRWIVLNATGSWCRASLPITDNQQNRFAHFAEALLHRSHQVLHDLSNPDTQMFFPFQFFKNW
jgi:hypothetical protein